MNFNIIPKIECPKCGSSFRPLQFLKSLQLKNTVKKNAQSGRSDKNKKLVNEGKICAICGNPLEIKWGILHGEGFCIECGAPYSMYKYNKEGIKEKNIHCSIKESQRAGYRSVYIKHRDDLEKYSEGDPVSITPVIQARLKASEEQGKKVEIQDATTGATITADEAVRCVQFLEKRELKDVPEEVLFLKGRGMIVGQQYNKASIDKEPVFYSFDRLKAVLAHLK